MVKYAAPTKKTGNSLVLSAVFVIVASSCLASTHRLLFWEASVFYRLYGLPGSLRLLFLAITLLGSLWFSILIGLWLVYKKRYALLSRFIWASSLTYLVVNLLKLAINRPRPYVLLGVSSRDPSAYGMGFPSGHSAQAAVVAFSLWLIMPKKYRFLLPLGVVLVMVSRIYLGVHAPLDVIAGACIGGVAVQGLKYLPGLSRLEKRYLKA